MSLVLEESEDISLELISPILASLKSENQVNFYLRILASLLFVFWKFLIRDLFFQEVPCNFSEIGGESSWKVCAKLRPCLIQAMKSLHLSLDDYSKVISSICNGTADADADGRKAIILVENIRYAVLCLDITFLCAWLTLCIKKWARGCDIALLFE